MEFLEMYLASLLFGILWLRSSWTLTTLKGVFAPRFSSSDVITENFLGKLALERTLVLNHLTFVFSRCPLRLGILWLNSTELLCVVLCILSGLSASYCEIAPLLILPLTAAGCQESLATYCSARQLFTKGGGLSDLKLLPMISLCY